MASPFDGEPYSTGRLAGGRPFFGPFVVGGGMDTIASSGTALPVGGPTELLVWCFDEAGNLLTGSSFTLSGQEQRVVRLSELFPDAATRRGMVALVHPPSGAPLVETWSLRFLAGGQMLDSVVSESPGAINTSPNATPFRMLSTEYVDRPGARSLVVVHNPSADPEYERTVDLTVTTRRPDGGEISTRSASVAPFGTAWLDLGSPPDVPHGASGIEDGRGTVTIRSAGGSAVGYHFIADDDGRIIGGDHTRPMLRYVSSGYGSAHADRDPSMKEYLVGAARLVLARMSGNRWLG